MARYLVSNRSGNERFAHAEGPIEFGRLSREGCRRHVLADDYVSGNQLRVEERPGGMVRLENLSNKVPIQFADGSRLEPGKVRVLPLPLRLTAGTSLIEITPETPSETDGGSLLTIAQPVLAQGTKWPSRSLLGLESSPSAERLTQWFETMVALQRSAASSSGFFEEIAQAALDLIGLDCGLVLLRGDGDWRTVARRTTENAPRVVFSRTILDRVCEERRTFYQGVDETSPAKSLAGVTTVVASPILSPDGSEVVGVVYGVKLFKPSAPLSEIRPLEASLVQVLAATAGAGMARMSSEEEAARRHVQFEQFFSRELAAELDRDPDLLIGRDREVTLLVSDIRGFSRIAERLGPRATCDLMGDVLERLTARIHEQGGVVVDYVGDGILAMWNAPVEQPDHAARACRAALAMLDELPSLNETWQARTGSGLALGLGINTGVALVGNSGSRQRLKYGPLGNTVNLASRVEGATKQLGVPILLTGPSHARLQGAFATRRLCQARVVGIDQPVELHELPRQHVSAEWVATRDAYEGALAHYEQGRWGEACRALYPILRGQDGGYDQPSLALAARCLECLRFPDRPFDPVIELSTK